MSGVLAHGDIIATRVDEEGEVMLPADYAREHVRLGYAATEPGNQSDTRDRSITLVAESTTGRGLYVGMTRGRASNHALVVTDSLDIGEARQRLEQVITHDRADVPAVARREQLSDDYALGPTHPSTQSFDPENAVQRPSGIEIEL